MAKIGISHSAEDDYRLEHFFSDRLLAWRRRLHQGHASTDLSKGIGRQFSRYSSRRTSGTVNGIRASSPSCSPHPCSKRITFQLEKPEPKTKPKKVRKPKPRKPRIREPKVPTRTAEEQSEARRESDQARNQTPDRKEFNRLQKEKARQDRKAAGLCKSCPNQVIPPARPAARPSAPSTIKAGTEARKRSPEPPSSRPKNVSKPDGSTNGQGPRILSGQRQLGSGKRNGGRSAQPHQMVFSKPGSEILAICPADIRPLPTWMILP